MEGVVDFQMRELLTRIGSFDRCVTEFIRVTDALLPARVFQRYCPELEQDSRTRSGTEVYVQLLGGDPLIMAVNARRAAELGSAGIDLNFGCPARTVNRRDGGSTLLQHPARVKAIVQAVRDAVPHSVPVSVKIRLGIRDSSQLSEICSGIQQAGASELCIHARTRQDGYQPPAFWSHIKPVRELLSMPVVVNGEIWNTQDADQARHESQCSDLMLGRGALACPDLSMQIRAHASGQAYTALPWPEVLELLQQSFDNTNPAHRRHTGNRLKQWLVYLKRQYPMAEALFQSVKQLKDSHAINSAIERHRVIALTQAH
ncbi:MAG: tRNA-dihydrouridine synthase [Gammaproteobacteria bacterium]|nr:tRNA-dihydrouridine synthase [Gammaproteobacteria bacterium]MBL6999096.1 tRNA-dihydrouridine synthase [Gammaproteobacteria bacterium]